MKHKIQHRPLLAPLLVIDELFPGEGLQYVCTTSLTKEGCWPADVFYRSTPHPEHGNHYVGVWVSCGLLSVASADSVGEYDFWMVEDDLGNLHYSQHRHDMNNGIDGGRSYLRCLGSPTVVKMRLKDGEFVCDE